MVSRLFWIGLSLALWAAMAFATVNSISPEDKVRQNIQQNYPQMKIDAIVVSPFHQLYQVTSGGMIFYVSSDGRYLLAGDVIDLQSKKTNLTEKARQALRLQLLKTIDPKDEMVYAPENPQYTVRVFTDLDCGFCREFHKQMSEFNRLGIAIHYLAFPRQGVGSPSFEKAASVWCATDRQKAFDELKGDKNDKSSVASENAVVSMPAACADIITKQFKLGQELGINGTPTLLLEDGSIIPGFVPPAQLLELVQNIKRN